MVIYSFTKLFHISNNFYFEHLFNQSDNINKFLKYSVTVYLGNVSDIHVPFHYLYFISNNIIASDLH